MKKYILKFEEIGIKDVGMVGGKNASLGEMIRTLGAKGVPVPSGFAVTADGYFHFLKETGLDEFIRTTLKGLDTKNFKDLQRCGKLVRDKMRKSGLAEAWRPVKKDMFRRGRALFGSAN